MNRLFLLFLASIFWKSIFCASVAASDDEPRPLATYETSGGAISVSSDLKRVAIGADYQGPLKIFDVEKGAEIATLEDRGGTYLSVHFSPDGKLLVALCVFLDPAENNLSLWDVEQKKRIWENKTGFSWARFTPDGKSLAAGTYGSIHFFNPRTGAPLKAMPAHREANTDFADYSRNGKWLATASEDDQQAIVWNAASGKMLKSIRLDAPPTAVALSDDGGLLAVAQNTKVSVFEAKSGWLKWSKKPYEESVRGLAFKPKSTQLASSSQEGKLHLWDAATGKALAEIQPERGMVQTVHFASSGELFVGASGATLRYPANLSGRQEASRIWKSADGKFSVQAQLAGREGEKVRLIRETDQKEIEVGLSQLSETDRQFVADWEKRAERGGGLRYEVQEREWKSGDESNAVSLLPASDGVAFLSGASGYFGAGEAIEVGIDAEKQWRLTGKSTEFLIGKAMTIQEVDPELFSPEVKEFRWSNGQPPVKMLRREEGICFLAGMSGAFRGFGEVVRVRLGEDGYWYLEGSSAQGELTAKAIALRWKSPETFSIEIEEKTWKSPEPRIELLKKEQGLCFLAALSGNFMGGGEVVNLTLEDDAWYLGGQSGQAELSGIALVVRIKRK